MNIYELVANYIDIILWNIDKNDATHDLDMYILYVVYVFMDQSTLHAVYVSMIVHLFSFIEWYVNVSMKKSLYITIELWFSQSP